MSTTALSGLRDFLCGSLSFDNMIWLSEQLSGYVKEHNSANNPLPHTKEELNAALDEAERQFEAGEYVSNEEVIRWIDGELSKDEQLEKMPIAV